MGSCGNIKYEIMRLFSHFYVFILVTNVQSHNINCPRNSEKNISGTFIIWQEIFITTIEEELKGASWKYVGSLGASYEKVRNLSGKNGSMQGDGSSNI